jgi:alkanesulfonate monooxygenase SsuD/methylene tetrahydromethanopterin reductase-like flavin-dependent oxidoreductase (luciferase family)
VWCGFGESTADAASMLAPAMETLYQRPFGDFARYAPHGTPDEVADALLPYATAGCATFNLIPLAVDDAAIVAGCARVRARLRELIMR